MAGKWEKVYKLGQTSSLDAGTSLPTSAFQAVKNLTAFSSLSSTALNMPLENIKPKINFQS